MVYVGLFPLVVPIDDGIVPMAVIDMMSVVRVDDIFLWRADEVIA